VECYSEKFKQFHGDPLPGYRPPMESDPAGSKEYPLQGTTRRPAEYVHTRFRNLAPMDKLYPAPLAFIHPVDAGKRGIGQHDPVQVKSPRGTIQVTARITEDLKPGLIAVDFGWGNPADQKPGMNLLTSDEVWDPVSGGYPNRLFLCEVTK